MPPKLPPMAAAFRHWTVIGHAFPQTRKIDGVDEWFIPCRCVCGTAKAVRTAQLLNGRTGSCGCRGNAGVGRSANQRLYNIWRGMLGRCHSANHSHYHLYGGRGIRMCAEWRASFKSFCAWALANGYAATLQCDRIDNDKGYDPTNCRWVTRIANHLNRRCVRFIYAFGESKCRHHWAVDPRCVVSEGGLKARLAHGWEAETALVTPPTYRPGRRWNGILAFGEVKSKTDWAKDGRCAVVFGTLKRRLKAGWSPENAITRPPTPHALRGRGIRALA